MSSEKKCLKKYEKGSLAEKWMASRGSVLISIRDET